MSRNVISKQVDLSVVEKGISERQTILDVTQVLQIR